MKKITYLLFIISSFFLISNVQAEDLKSISMDIRISQDGIAHITEKWTMNTSNSNDHTELYKPYYNYGNSTFQNFKVSLNGQEFAYTDNWDIDASFESKKYKNGFNHIDQGIELCWGLTSRNTTNTYVITYEITNFILGLEDQDMLYWNLIPKNLSDKPENIYIKIYSDFPYDNNLPVWGYGKKGAYTYVYDGYIEMVLEETLQTDEYMTILVKYPKNTFDTTNNKSTETFDYYLNMANEGAESYVEEQTNNLDAIIEFLPLIIMVAATIIGTSMTKGRVNITGNKKIKFTKTTRKLPKEVNYFRDIPCNKDIYYAYWLSKTYKLNKKDTDLLGAVLLKWINEGKVMIQKDKATGIFKKEKSSLVLNRNITFDLYLEKELYDMIFEASMDGVLEAQEFKRWADINYNELFAWFKRILDYQTQKLAEEQKLIQINNTKYETTQNIYEDAINLKGLKKFLEDFSRIHEKNPIEVHLWKEYLMFAQILGIAQQVSKDFKNIYPDIINDEYLEDFTFIYFVSTSGINSAGAAKTRAESYNSGGGGFSSGGGGMGSFGGGFGGGGAR